MRRLDGAAVALGLWAGLACGGRADEPGSADARDALPAAAPGGSARAGGNDPSPVRSAPAEGLLASPGEGREPRRGADGVPTPPATEELDPPTEPARPRGVAVLEQLCGACHGSRAARAGNVQGFGDIEDIDALVERGWIIPLRSTDSYLMQVMADGSMPPPGVAPRPSADDLEAVARFIDAPRFWPEPEAAVDAGASTPEL